MFCPKCGTQIPENDHYCPTCGEPVLGKTNVPDETDHTAMFEEEDIRRT
ncbi:MAG: zinc ribbon domain-containing protein, partial [Oscillospiraceae bacterium]|nr:zinc ribbon domain-containing protein [Oscillospiraceae bacterium]